MATLPFSDIVTVAVNVGATSTVRSTFNVGLIIGSSEVISKDTRIKSYSQIEDMTADGWKGNEPEYLAAQLYFSQNPKPSVFISPCSTINKRYFFMKIYIMC